MKVTGLITEYNPFHKGHEYHIQEAKKQTKADYIVALMSGDFVQRGAPACVPKHTRTHMALVSGVDLVIELPLCYATGTAERFAQGAVSIFHQLGVIDTICFGSECGNADLLMKIAHILSDEPDWYRERLQKNLKDGLSFPAARAASLPEYKDILNSPNNILGIEYCKALIRLHSHIRPYAISRKGTGYHEPELPVSSTGKQDFFPSATALRNQLNTDSFQNLTDYIPAPASIFFINTLRQQGYLTEDDFSQCLLYKLLQAKTPEDYLAYEDVSSDLASRIFRYRFQFQYFSQFADLLKTKDITRTRINRALLHILLDTKKEDPKAIYARILGFQKNTNELLSSIKGHSSIPFFSKTTAARKRLNPSQLAAFEATLSASALYEGISAQKTHRTMISEHQKPIVIIG